MIAKSEIRKINKARRNAMERDEVVRKSGLAQAAFLKSDLYTNSRQIMLYMPLGNEIGTEEMMQAAFKDGKKVVLPITDGKTGEITPYLIEENTEFVIGAFKVREPLNASVADTEKTDVIIVPGIAFDERGARVGFGKGCYDRLLAETNAVKVGYCYEYQVSDEIADEAHDMRMDYILTEIGIRKVK